MHIIVKIYALLVIQRFLKTVFEEFLLETPDVYGAQK